MARMYIRAAEVGIDIEAYADVDGYESNGVVVNAWPLGTPGWMRDAIEDAINENLGDLIEGRKAAEAAARDCEEFHENR